MGKTNELNLTLYWSEIPIGKENAVTYADLVNMWDKPERAVRAILHELSLFDNGDDYILIRSASGKGFYKTDDAATIRSFKKECLNKGKSIFAPVRKINRVLSANPEQFTFDNNLRAIRAEKQMKQNEVCARMKEVDKCFDVSMLSKMENSVCLPTPYQLGKLAEIYGCNPADLVKGYMYM